MLIGLRPACTVCGSLSKLSPQGYTLGANQEAVRCNNVVVSLKGLLDMEIRVGGDITGTLISISNQGTHHADVVRNQR